MEKFYALPTPHKAGILAAVMVLLGWLMHFSLIADLELTEAAAVQNKAQLKTEVEKLEKDVGDIKLDALVKEEKELTAEKKTFSARLPKAQEMEKFITGMSEMARNSGLELLSFKKGKKQTMHYYFEVPVEMEVQGTFRELIGFLRTISDKDHRVVHIRSLSIEQQKPPIGDIITKYETRRREETPDGASVKQLDPAAKLMQLVRAHEEAIHQGVQLKCKFTGYVFSYTGEPASDKIKKRIKSKKKKRDQKRKEMLSK